jgi:hypothetical protein
VKARHRSAAEALRFVVDDLQTALVEAWDEEVIEVSRGSLLRGYQAGQVRELIGQAMQADRRPPRWPSGAPNTRPHPISKRSFDEES